MAEDNDPASKTEEPSARRLADAHAKGDVAKSQDLTSWASLAGSAGAVAIAGGSMCRDLATHLLPFIDHPDAFQLGNGGALVLAQAAAMAAAAPLMIVFSASMITGAAGNLIQTGFLWATDKLKFDASKLNPLNGIKRLFGLDGFMAFLRSLFKVLVVGGVAWWMIKPHATELQGLAGVDPAAILPFTADLLRGLLYAILAVLGVGAMLDWMWQRQRFSARMRMSREEMKEESRQSDGDPQVKQRQRQIRSDRARRRMMQAVPKATVVITNPTHFAVALRYEQDKTDAPICVAKGADLIALRIRALAEEHKVPVIEDPPLARALFSAVEVDEAIPHHHYAAVAKVIGFVLNGAKRRRAQPLRP